MAGAGASLTESAKKFICEAFDSWERGVRYVMFTSNLIAYPNGFPLTHKNISEIMKCSICTTKRVMSELVDKKVVARCRVGKSYKYFANPYIFCKGTSFNATLVEMFKSYHGV